MRLIEWLRELLDRLLGRSAKEPSPLRFFNAEVSEMNINLSVEFAAPTERQRALAYASVEMRVVPDNPAVDPPWSEVVQIPAANTTDSIEDVAEGNYELRARAVDVAGKKSAYSPSVLVAVAMDDPSPLVSFSATLA